MVRASLGGATITAFAPCCCARRLYSKLSARIAVSEAARWTAQRYYGGRYRVIPNGVDLSAARPDDSRPNGELRLLFVGRAEERKGLPPPDAKKPKKAAPTPPPRAASTQRASTPAATGRVPGSVPWQLCPCWGPRWRPCW